MEAEPEPTGDEEPRPRPALRSYRGRHRADKKRSFLRELPILIVIAFVTALVLKSYVLQAFYIPSASMEPTLREGDRVIVEKIGYRFGDPERGDVVVFERVLEPTDLEPDSPVWEDVWTDIKALFGFPTGGTQDFIKRVVAVGGESVEGRDGRVFVDGEAIDEPYLPDGTTTSDFPPTEVPEGMIFVMGDNRANSSDSRSFGPISVDQILGRGVLLVWPPSDFSTL